MGLSGHLLVGAGPPAVTINDFQGLWAKDAPQQQPGQRLGQARV